LREKSIIGGVTVAIADARSPRIELVAAGAAELSTGTYTPVREVESEQQRSEPRRYAKVIGDLKR